MNRDVSVLAKPAGGPTPQSAGRLLQRKCACGTHTFGGGVCASCADMESGLRRNRRAGGPDPVPPVRAATSMLLQRQEVVPEKSNDDKMKEGLGKLAEGFLETPVGKELLENVKKGLISTWPRKIFTGTLATGTVAALAASHEKLPVQIPEIPLDFIAPGFSVKITYNGPVDKPADAMIEFKFAEQTPPAIGGNKVPTESEKFAAETARIAADQAKFRAGLKFPKGSPEDLAQRAEEEAVRQAVLKRRGGIDIDAIIKKFPALGPNVPGGPQLTMPPWSFRQKRPALLGGELELKMGNQDAPGDRGDRARQRKADEIEPLQRKLSIGSSDDALEREADRVAEQVLSGPAANAVAGAPPRIQRFSPEPSEGREQVPPSVDRTLDASGAPLDIATRQDMEQRFGRDFSQVRIHQDSAAGQSAREVGAHAYTVGSHIVFAPGRFAPQSSEGRRLLAHELTHVVQQQMSREASRLQRRVEPDFLSDYPVRETAVPKRESKPVAPKKTKACAEFPGGETTCEVDSKTGTPTGKVIHKVFETNPCTKPCVELHEDVHVKQFIPFCPKLRDCYISADKGTRDPADCFKMALSGGGKLECPAYNVSILCLEERLANSKSCQSETNRAYATRKLETSEKCFRDKYCGAGSP